MDESTIKSQVSSNNSTMSPEVGHPPIPVTQQSEVRVVRYPDPSALPVFLRPMLLLTRVFRHVLLWTRVDSRIVTFGWFVVGLCAHGVTALGTSWSFVVGAVLVYIKVSLDIVDGEIGRYQKRFMSDEDDLTSHMKGIYLDRVQHIIESPLWGLALGVGVYRLTGNVWMLPCGLCVAVFRSFWRFEKLLQEHIARRFASRLVTVRGKVTDAGSKAATPVWSRLFGKVELWLRNGKRFNLAILVCGSVDWVLSEMTMTCMQMLLVASAPACLCSIVFRIISTQFGNGLVRASNSCTTVVDQEGV